MSHTYEVPFLIAGGGIGGLAAALSVAKTGQSVQVLEQAHEFGEVGAGLQLGPNAMAALDHFGLLESISEYAVFPKRLVIMDALSGKELTSLDLGDSFRQRFGYPYAVMHRTDLHTVLLNACRNKKNITLTTNKMVVAFEDLGAKAKVVCADGTTYIADALIGADGIKSKTRKLFADDELICSEYVAYRGTIPTVEVKDHARLDEVTCWIGPELHLVQYPVRRKELFNQVVVFKSHFYSKELEQTTQWATPEEMDERFSQCCPPVRNFVSYINRDFRWPLFDRNPIGQWTKGRIALLGDSAHPMLQYLAQGACQALEDAVALGEQLQHFHNDIEKAFPAYEKERTVRTAQVQRNARKFGDILHTGDDVAVLLRNTIFTQRHSDDYTFVEWLYGYNVPSIHS
ncbi:FAD-dependent monooxygenase [Brevibacillus choshinensis]|uniref:FAD-dependent monooxygenase n=1 Tax=Brevibacillus choshinensis TaxID=54911 RepID=UPI002E204359|nr:FAD-dependent monooxygenase [Brevibacillus choshinensis]MED4583246.1 FAD-dependent monooxygenase [Brevibacillus choshinensis]MED4782869.1 FAD-dependent monooxygenase [Brevibacillus choshinensis]